MPKNIDNSDLEYSREREKRRKAREARRRAELAEQEARMAARRQSGKRPVNRSNQDMHRRPSRNQNMPRDRRPRNRRFD